MLQPPAEDETFANFAAEPANIALPSASDEYMLCRFCAQLKHYEKELLDLAYDSNSHSRFLRILKFFKIDFIDLSEQSLLPKTTCEPCYNSLQESYNFFRKVKQSQVTLCNLYSTDCHVKTEPSSEDNLDTINSMPVLTSLFPQHKKLKSETDDFPFLPTNKAPESISVNANIIHTPSFEDVITDQSIETKLSEPDCHYSDTEQDVKDTDDDVKNLVPLYTGIPIYDNDKLKASWNNYEWTCHHCNRKYSNVARLRRHGMSAHNTCYQLFKCNECKEMIWDEFDDFINHVRTHKTYLKNLCKYCDDCFETDDKCKVHETEHETISKVCSFCGELFPSTTALKRHNECTFASKKNWKKRQNRKVKQLGLYEEDCSWENYEWTCQECCQRTPTVSLLREHIQNVHNKCFAMKCVDCLRVMTNYRMFAEHVRKHRPYLKKYCQYCNEIFSDPDLVSQHIESQHLNDPQQKPCDGCGQIFPDLDQLSAHMKTYKSPRRRGSLRVEDITCDICQKICQSLQSFRQHRMRHDEQRKRDYTCDSCGKSFYTAGMLKEHIKTHDVKTEVCEICKKKFHTKPKLKAHVATHSGLRPYTCDECGKCFRTDKRLKVHCLLHTDIKPYKCLACGKEFRYKIGLKVHENQHTGLRPYPCERCDKAFANWANCNKHMIRKHGISLAKTKLTALGRLDINRETGQPTNITADEHAREWMDKLINVKKGRGAPIKTQMDQPSTS